MKHTIIFNTKDDLITWLDENFPDAKLNHVKADGADYETNDCLLEVQGLHLTLTFKTIQEKTMRMSGEDRYYEAPYDDGYPDDWDAKVEEYTNELLADECNWQKEINWYEGVSECGCTEEYPTPSHAPVELITKVQEYWYDIAFRKATEYYEENPND